MSWFKLDDQGHDHPKVLKAGNEAFGAWCRAGQWSSKHLTEGIIPREVALTIAPVRVWDRLLAVGLLDQHPDGWAMHDFLAYNPRADEVRAERARKAKNVAEHRSRKRGVTDPVTAHVTGYMPGKLPARNHGPDPDPDPSSTTTTTYARAGAAREVFDRLADSTRGADLDVMGEVADRLGRALDALAPELRWPDLGAEVASWIADARLQAAAAKDRGDYWSPDRLVTAIDKKAQQRIRFRPKDARLERERDRMGPTSSSRGPQSQAGQITKADEEKILADHRRARERAAQ